MKKVKVYTSFVFYITAENGKTYCNLKNPLRKREDFIFCPASFLTHKAIKMHQTKKGNEWRFGMKYHIGVDAGTGYVHTVTATSANVHDITETHNLLREDDEVVYGDSGYIGIEKREEIINDENLSKIDFRITRRPSSLPKVSDNSIDWERYIDYRKSSVRSKVEHAFHIIKNRFGFNKVRYRGIAKNLNKLNVLFASANLLMYAEAKKRSVKIKG